MPKTDKTITIVRVTITTVVLSILLGIAYLIVGTLWVISYLIVATFNTQIGSCTNGIQIESKSKGELK